MTVASHRLELWGVTVVDVRTGARTPDRVVTVRGDRIESIRGADGEAPAGAIDARGRFVVPGYLDMHAHALGLRDPAGTLALMLAHGITGFRQMAGSPGLLGRRTDGALDLGADAPALLALPGSLLTPANGATPDAARAVVQEQRDQGADFVKVALLSPEAFAEAQAEGRRIGIPIAGHLPAAADVAAASRGGIRSIEHLGPGIPVLAACSTEEAAIRAEVAGDAEIRLPRLPSALLEPLLLRLLRRIVLNPVARSTARDVDRMRRAIAAYREDRARALAERFVADGTWHCPTLIRQRTSAYADAAEYRSDPDLRYLDPGTLKQWRAAASRFEGLPAGHRATFRAVYEHQLRILRAFDEVGVPMLTGSDATGAVWVVPGPSLHREFDQLAGAGLSPLTVLRMATLRGAEFLGRTQDMGTVEPGKLADLVLLEQDPTERVDHLHGIAGVVRAGRHRDRAALARMKEQVAADRSVH